MTTAAAAAVDHPAAATARHPGRRIGRWIGSGALLVVALVCALLALWQVQRLQWKTALLARVVALPNATAAPLPEAADWPALSRATDEYRLLRLQGRWLPEATQTVRASTALGRGHWVMTPLVLADGRLLWVNRGFVDDAHRLPGPFLPPRDLAAAARTGLLRFPETSALPLLAPVLRDPQRLSAAAGLRGERTAPFFVDLTADPGAGPGAGPDASAGTPALPRAGLTVLQFRNPHLGYALTWAALALGALAGAALWWWPVGRMRGPARP